MNEDQLREEGRKMDEAMIPEAEIQRLEPRVRRKPWYRALLDEERRQRKYGDPNDYPENERR